MSFYEVMFLLLVSHSVCDFALQNDYVAKAKNMNDPLGSNGIWAIVLSAHSLIHAGGVYVVTQSIILAFIQFFTHWIIDFLKCDDKITYMDDQLYHVLIMVLITLLYVTNSF